MSAPVTKGFTASTKPMAGIRYINIGRGRGERTVRPATVSVVGTFRLSVSRYLFIYLFMCFILAL
jgi:hypothetical protein